MDQYHKFCLKVYIKRFFSKIACEYRYIVATIYKLQIYKFINYKDIMYFLILSKNFTQYNHDYFHFIL